MPYSFKIVIPVCFLSFVIIICSLNSCQQKPTSLFKKSDPAKTGIRFSNDVIENDSVNPIDLEFLYNGGGVAVGDFDNNGLPDLYFTASISGNKLYLNNGNLSFRDVTDAAHATGEGRWANAASVVDINNDGWKDIYVCATIKKNAADRRNLLYVNQGLDANKVPVFKEMAEEYQLADTSHSVHAAFFDYDNDGDLDMYLVTTKLAGRTATVFGNNGVNDATTDIDKLFRNDYNEALKHPVYTDVSKEAKIIEGGYGLGVSITDINSDGWKDIYVTNDFFSNDLLYINNKNGTFTNKAKEYFKHTSRNAMGNDIADINNDGLPDVLAVDMNPEDNFRKKKNMGSNNYFVYQNMMFGEYNLQYVRNTLQLNQGPAIKSNDSVSDPVFSEISFLAGVAQTDWSWNASIADFDNDGFRDIIITNGYPRDVTDHDFGAFRQKAGNLVSRKDLIAEIPQIRIPNYAFQNTRTLKFKDVTADWGMNLPSFSNGAVYVDLDNDGDLDYVINNINETALVYENTLNTKEHIKANFLQIKFEGSNANRNGLGAIAAIYYGTKKQVYENSPYRGYLSSVNDLAYFGIDTISTIDSVVIFWQNGNKQVLRKVETNQVLKVNINNAKTPINLIPETVPSTLFADITASVDIRYRHEETDVIDFDVERLLPHKLSQYGPGIAAGDIDGNGTDDMIIGGNNIIQPTLLLQQTDGKFISRTLPYLEGNDLRRPENMGILLFDADSDGDQDLYLSAGSNEYPVNTKNYEDRLFLNDGKGNFIFNEAALPKNFTSKSCVKAVDFDKDGDLDLFIGGRVLPGSYPLPVSSFIYRNDSKDKDIKFTDISKQAAPFLTNIGLVCDALWTDFDNDGWTDLIVTGEWMAIRFFKNNNGSFADVTEKSGIQAQTGWWNSITGGDFDNDGDIDYVLGNLGENSFYKASEKYPINIYAKDFDGNGSIDAITTTWLKDQQQKLKEYTVHNKDDINSQLPALKKKFLSYKAFAVAEFKDLFSEAELKGMLSLSVNNLESSYLKNIGNGKFELQPLPEAAQLAPVYGMVADDFNNDGNLDLSLVGNDYGTEVTNGRYDAFNGLIMLGNGKGGFEPQTILQGGLFVPGDAKSLVKLRDTKGNYLLAASQNRGLLKVFRAKQMMPPIALKPGDKYAIVYLKNGLKRKEEFYYGNSFLSQSAWFLEVNEAVQKVEIINGKSSRTIDLSQK
ncbi:VCBS repeat-containing protein [Flavitalea sp.]|nr:VCBS repeat-containing protein [Flavitalea sp.]